jgi:hypothetical protein
VLAERLAVIRGQREPVEQPAPRATRQRKSA